MPLFQLLVLCMLASKPIDATIAMQAARELFGAGLKTPKSVLAANRQTMIEAFGRAHYARYDESSATRLADIATAVRDEYGGDLRGLADTRDIATAKRLLKQFKGIGDTGADIFLREVQDVWTWVRPHFDRRATAAARDIGLPSDPERLGALARGGRRAWPRLWSGSRWTATCAPDWSRDPDRHVGLVLRPLDRRALPARLGVSKRLARYVEEFDTVELNASFYRGRATPAFTGWRERLPDGFTMSVKAHRGLTHFRRLKSPEPWVERFERCWKGLGDRAEALLVQLHPECSATIDGWTTSSASCHRRFRWRWSCAIRRGTTPPCSQLLERRGAAYVVMSGAQMPCVPRATSDLVYVRMHGPEPASLYTGSYFRRRPPPMGRPSSRRGTTRAGAWSCTSTTTSVAMRCATRAGSGS
jgi:hypothetical protein